MFTDDNEEDDSSVAVVRYQCMPSLVSLQQMRNRLHLAETGKKLMKWTSMATSRELRVLAMDICIKYESFREDVRKCFMLLARARYFNPQLNGMVLQNVSNKVTTDIERKAAVTVTSNSKSVSGVRVTYFTILEKDIDPSAHLGLEKGGTTITEAKRAWRDVLRRMVLMASLRASFIEVETAKKNAIKKQHVLEKVVMPRTKATIAYILDQMDEMRREEFYRIKRILANKKKVQVKLQLQKNLCSHKRVLESCPYCRSLEPETIKEELVDIPEPIEELGVIEPESMKVPVLPNENLPEKTEREVTCVCDTLINELTELSIRLSGIVERVEESLTPEDISRDLILCLCDKVIAKEAEDTARAIIFDATENIEEFKEKTRVDKKVSSIAITKSVLNTDRRYLSGANAEDLELGTFEIEVIETTKIIRVKNEDGTVSEQKIIMKKKVERRNPSQPDANMEGVPSGNMDETFFEEIDIDETFTEDMGIDEIYTKTSNKSSKVKINDDAKRIGIALIKPEVLCNLRKVESNNLPSVCVMADPIKRCLSTSSIFSNIYYNCMSRDSITSVLENELLMLSDEMETMLDSVIHRIHDNHNVRKGTKLNGKTCSLTNSEIHLFKNTRNPDKTVGNSKSKSSNDFKDEIKRKRMARCMSFNLEDVCRIPDSDSSSSNCRRIFQIFNNF